MTDFIKQVDEFLQKKNKADEKKEESEAGYLYENVKTGEVFTYTRRGGHKKDGTLLVYRGKS